MAKDGELIGVDIGGTKVSICLGNMEGHIMEEKRIPTKELAGPKEGLLKIFEMIESLKTDKVKAIGVAVPGPMSLSQGKILAPPNLPKWIDVPIVDQLKKYFDLPVFINNDGNAGALAEWEYGEAKHVNHLIYLTMSTGMGGGIVANGKLLQGETDTAGEVGHFVLNPKGPPCLCGQRGCFEVYCGGKSLALFIQKEIKEKKMQTQILQEANGVLEDIDIKCLTAAVSKGDPFALEVWEKFIERLSQGIGILLMTLNPDAIILGTIAMHAKDLVMKPLKEKLATVSWKAPLENCLIAPSRLGDKVAQMGALAIAAQGLKL